MLKIIFSKSNLFWKCNGRNVIYLKFILISWNSYLLFENVSHHQDMTKLTFPMTCISYVHWISYLKQVHRQSRYSDPQTSNVVCRIDVHLRSMWYHWLYARIFPWSFRLVHNNLAIIYFDWSSGFIDLCFQVVF